MTGSHRLGVGGLLAAAILGVAVESSLAHASGAILWFRSHPKNVLVDPQSFGHFQTHWRRWGCADECVLPPLPTTPSEQTTLPGVPVGKGEHQPARVVPVGNKVIKPAEKPPETPLVVITPPPTAPAEHPTPKPPVSPYHPNLPPPPR